MCGILFYFNRSENISLQKFREALGLQTHRGPDHEGIACIPSGSGRTISRAEPEKLKNPGPPASMAFGHKRLSIVDLSVSSNQPVISQNGKDALIFNGEFYNYADYAETPQTGKSDTLSLFSLLQTRGITALKEVNGMWGLCYYSGDTQTLYLARDRYGKKPLYYYRDDTSFIASSEIKSIYALLESPKRTVSTDGLAYYILGKQTPFLNDGNTFYKNIFAVRPGEILAFDTSSHTLRPYGRIGFEDLGQLSSKDTANEDSFLSMLRRDITESIQIRLKSEVPLTILASGGVDSSWIAGIAGSDLNRNENLSLHTCHIVDADNTITEDLEYARAHAKDLGLPLHEVRVEPQNEEQFLDIARTLTRQVELPVNFFLATIPTYLMTKDMRERNIKVVLDGIGGDEIMGGYPSYTPLILANMRKWNFLQGMYYFRAWQAFNKPSMTQTVQMLKSSLKSIVTDSNMQSSAGQFEETFKNYIRHPELINSMRSFTSSYFTRHKLCSQTQVQNFEIEKYQLPYYLGIADQMSMINSVENRSPFLDARLHKYIRMPERYKFRNGYNKYALRASMPANIPDKYKWRWGKEGIGNAFSQNLVHSQKARECIMDSAFLRSFLDTETLEQMQETPDYKYLARPLFSLALLDDIYKLSL